jgi:hypothetical protein
MTSSRIARVLVGCLLTAGAPLASAQNAPAPLTLDEAVRLYPDRNLGVEAARLAVERTRADRIAAGLRPDPGITVTAERRPAHHHL